MCGDVGQKSGTTPEYTCDDRTSPRPVYKFWTLSGMDNGLSAFMPAYCEKKEGAFSTSLNNEGSPLSTYIAKRYKPVAKRVKPVKTTLPEEYRILRVNHPDPLRDLPTLPTKPPIFTPGVRYTTERYENHKKSMKEFLWPEEEKLAHELVKLQEDVFAWEEIEKGRLKDEFFAPVVIPTIEHIPWALRNIPIPPGIYDRVIAIITGEDGGRSLRSIEFVIPVPLILRTKERWESAPDCSRSTTAKRSHNSGLQTSPACRTVCRRIRQSGLLRIPQPLRRL
jgi:hypothetical protein